MLCRKFVPFCVFFSHNQNLHDTPSQAIGVWDPWWNMFWLVDLLSTLYKTIVPPIRSRFITDPKLQLLGLWYRVGLGCDWKTQHGTNVLHHMPNVGHDVIYRGVLGSCEGIEVCDWSNSCNLPIAVTSAVGLRCMRAVLYLSKNAGCSITHRCSINWFMQEHFN